MPNVCSFSRVLNHDQNAIIVHGNTIDNCRIIDLSVFGFVDFFEVSNKNFDFCSVDFYVVEFYVVDFLNLPLKLALNYRDSSKAQRLIQKFFFSNSD